MSKKVVSFFQKKNRGDTVSCRPGWHQPWRHWLVTGLFRSSIILLIC